MDANGVATASVPVPLCVDLDGTLLRTDMLFESLVAALRRNPLLALMLPLWLLRGRAHLKARLAAHATFDPGCLPYDEAVLALIRHERAGGRQVVLATASDTRIAERIAAHLGCFDAVVASDGRSNLKAQRKASRLAELYGEQGFDYVGNDAADLPVWARARIAHVVARGPALAARVKSGGGEVRHLERTPASSWPLLRALRVHQWAKNLLVFTALFTAHRLGDTGAIDAAMFAFIAFCFAGSATYLLNDLADLEHDRRHPEKRRRSLASGELPLWVAIVLAPCLLLLAAAIALPLPRLFHLELLLYVAATSAYSLWLKRIVLVDVFTLAALYGLRIVAGAAAIAVPVSDWLLVFSLFLFLSLALAKRYTELSGLARREAPGAPGRGYRTTDRVVVGIFGVACGQVSVLVFSLYIASPDVRALYQRPGLLWIVCPLLLYWVARMWLRAYREELNEDPLLFALRDPQSLALGVATLATMVAAT